MFCQNCGSEMEVGSQFCSECGEKAELIVTAETKGVVSQKYFVEKWIIICAIFVIGLCAVGVFSLNAPGQSANNVSSIFAEKDGKVYFLDLKEQYDLDYNFNIPLLEVDMETQSVRTIDTLPINLTGEVRVVNNNIYSCYLKFFDFNSIDCVGGIIKTDVNTGEQEELIKWGNAICFGLQIVDNRMYYLIMDAEDERSKLYSSDLTGMNFEIMFTADSEQILTDYYIDNDSIYIVTWNNYEDFLSIKKLNLDGAEQVDLMTIQAEWYDFPERQNPKVILGKQIFYAEEVGDKLYTINKLNPANGDTAVLTTEIKDGISFYADDKWLYFQNNDSGISKIKHDGSGQSKVWEEPCYISGVAKGWVYLETEGNRGMIGISTKNATRVPIISSDALYDTQIIHESNNWIFGRGEDAESEYDGNLKYFMCHHDGSNFKWLT